jgi:ABC-2 type transport system ATP-binding protein
MSEPILIVDKVHKRYGSTVALNGLTMSVGRGELFGLLGPNGAGKTTLLSILAGQSDADSGSVTLTGKPFKRSERERRRLVGIGTQDLAVYPDLTARENVRFFGRLYGLNGGKLDDRTQELLTAVGLADRADTRAGTFSGGMKRRLNLAVAVVHTPTLLLLDEPTTGVDPQSRNLIFDVVKRLNREGMTVVYTSHYMEEVQALCPRIAVMDGGRVIACDTCANLLRLHVGEITLLVPEVTDGFFEAVRKIAGVETVRRRPTGLTIRTHDIGPLLPHVAEMCLRHDVRPTSMTTNEPSLEKVFLQLTGKALRD